nr:unnamed protein product [Callosobruchus chinensis]
MDKKTRIQRSGRVLEKDKRGRHGNHYRVGDDIKQSVRNHINSIPRIESHYCRSHSTKEYIDGSKSIADLHRDYIELRKQQKLPFANYP